MEQHWENVMESLSVITVTSNPNNQPVTITGTAPDIRCVGVGTDAAVFQSIHAPKFAFKMYATDKKDKVKIEEDVYRRLGESPFFSKCYASTDRILVLSFEEGVTLFDCLLQGIRIPKNVIQDVENARVYVQEKGLNPRDIHLKNILMQHGKAKILDVSEYVKEGNDFRWEHLKRAYDEYYYLIEGKTVPFWLLETIRKWYHQWNKYSTTFDEFMKYVLKHTTYKK
ncbi:serine/threonine protein kinase [Alkalihalobacterium bogoriense]|uniref:serine/threonine protein kinase n=1 Tax=Alkalihalobacterium bogoriense TaxID=246272 RepID=UPI00047D6E3C|nr:serine/threonine protein kinase [Alkalihalobacterium bogoriense]